MLLYQMLDLSDPERQVAFYEDRENLVTDRLEALFTRTQPAEDGTVSGCDDA